MQVRNKLTGSTTHVANDDASIHALIKLGILEVVPPPAPDFSIKWSVGYRPASSDHYQGAGVPADKLLVIELSIPISSEKRWYSSHPDGAKASFKSQGRDCPDDIIADYRKRWGADRPKQLQATGPNTIRFV